MKQIFFITFIYLISLNIYGQTIDYIQINQIHQDSISIITNFYYYNEVYPENKNTSISNDTIHINLCHFLTTSSTPGRVIDTSKFRVFPNINYTLDVKIYGIYDTSEQCFNNLTNQVVTNFTTPLTSEIYLSEKKLLKNSFTLYPIPTDDYIYLKTGDYVVNKIQIIDLSGQVIYVTDKVLNGIDIRDLKKGMYFIKIFSSDKTYIKKIIKN